MSAGNSTFLEVSMRMATRLFGLAAAGLLSAGVAQAQKHEFGVDLALVSSKVDVPGADNNISLGTPLDVRIGFVSAGKLSWETRFTFNYEKEGDVSGMLFTPGVNVLYKLGAATNTQGLYLTGGGQFALISADDGTDSESFNQLGVNVGIGHRKPIGTASLRTEVFFANQFENDDFAAATAFGIRFGISLWH